MNFSTKTAFTFVALMMTVACNNTNSAATKSAEGESCSVHPDADFDAKVGTKTDVNTSTTTSTVTEKSSSSQMNLSASATTDEYLMFAFKCTPFWKNAGYLSPNGAYYWNLGGEVDVKKYYSWYADAREKMDHNSAWKTLFVAEPPILRVFTQSGSAISELEKLYPNNVGDGYSPFLPSVKSSYYATYEMLSRKEKPKLEELNCLQFIFPKAQKACK